MGKPRMALTPCPLSHVVGEGGRHRDSWRCNAILARRRILCAFVLENPSLFDKHCPMAIPMLTLRPAQATDGLALAALIVQLFQSEMPGVLRGAPDAQVALFRYMLEHELLSGVTGRYLALNEQEQVVGTASLRLGTDSATVPLPRHLLAVLRRSLGLGDSLRFAVALLRGSLSGETPLRHGEGYIYSVVVNGALRGQGVGGMMMAQLEATAREAGVHEALLRVLLTNRRAHNFYLRQGYQVIAQPAAWVRWFGAPSVLLRKQI
ncbi:MAG: GNAT family N-acetyltransferase [Candidatus Viridilinea halotolerans]|uniref:GNAT family N-acetyltransferase n=1 Tax=Candidatus Viridilinea halotolerans TaxID=2491704 RepID=A0A426U3A3_9CHLR|nr:MAG: GNAT family N-acetyltransferase [Candidatus Viridilinea halotolerans]